MTLTPDQKSQIEPFLLSRRSTRDIASWTGLDAEAIDAWRIERMFYRKRTHNDRRTVRRRERDRQEQEAIRNGVPLYVREVVLHDDGRLLAALAGQPLYEDAPAPLGKPVIVRREMAA